MEFDKIDIDEASKSIINSSNFLSNNRHSVFIREFLRDEKFKELVYVTLSLPLDSEYDEINIKDTPRNRAFHNCFLRLSEKIDSGQFLHFEEREALRSGILHQTRRLIIKYKVRMSTPNHGDA
jgi:hypothetical protein